MGDPENNWIEWSKFVLKTLERHESEVADLRNQVNLLKIKAAVVGFIVAAVTSIMTSVVTAVITNFFVKS